MPKIILIFAVASSLFGGVALGQEILTQTVSNSAGKMAADGAEIFQNTGLGMAVGTSTADGVIIHNGFLAGGLRGEDKIPPQIDPAPADIVAFTDANRCATVVQMPQIQVTDNWDITPTITMVIQTTPPQNVEPGQDVLLARGSYDVVVTASDRAGNRTPVSFRIDVNDDKPATLVAVPDPTPANNPAEAVSPLGTAIDIAWACQDNCDANPTRAREPAAARFPLGDTRVQLVCADLSGNRSTQAIDIRVRDTSPPVVAGAMPNAINAECNTAQGARIDVPRVVWQDNGSAARDLQLSLIVNPGANQRLFENVPGQVDLLSGANVLRFVAIDAAGNEASVDLGVQVQDTAAPTIEVLTAPQNGWHGGDQPLEVVLQLNDGCSQDQIAFEVQPVPTSVARDGNRVTLTYEDEGIYEMQITATDADGNVTRNNAVAFGIDRAPPAAILAIPVQVGIVADDPSTYPIFALAESLALNAGAEDDADGQVSGIASVRVVLDPGTANETVVADKRFDLRGSPRRGPRVGRNVGCTEGAAGGCGDDDVLNLRSQPVGDHVLEVTVTDAAGNSGRARGFFRSADLRAGVGILRPQLLAMANEAGVAGPVAQRLNLAANFMGQIRDLTERRLPGSTWRTPRFLGAAINSANSATLRLTQAQGAAQADRPDRIGVVLNQLHRFIKSDITLMRDYTLSRAVGERPEYLDTALDVDDSLTGRALGLMDQALVAKQWSDSMGNARLAFFHAKSAYEQWIMDYQLEPSPADLGTVLGEYGQSAEILQEISDEIGIYLQVAGAPGTEFMRRLRDRVQRAADVLELLADRGFDVDAGGLSDQAYIEALLELRDASNFSAVAGNQGAWVRNYQWSMMQVVRFMTHASVADAMFWRGANRRAWPLYLAANGHIADGVALLDGRRIQGLIDLYGENVEVGCLLVAVYHCDFLDDEDNDADEPIPDEQVPDACWEMMLRPNEWANVEAGQRSAQCMFGQEVRDIRGG